MLSYSFGGANSRIFSVDFEGEERMENIDIARDAGQPNKALKITSPIVPVMDGFLTVSFQDSVPKQDNPTVSGIEIVRAGDHYSHAVSGGPYTLVDVDGDGWALVAVDASRSHTHGPGHTISTFSWRIGSDVVADGSLTNLNLTVGVHDVTLTIVDTSGSISSDPTVITVKQKGFPELFVLTPASGGIAGGTSVTINGQDIGTATAVKFGRVLIPASQFTVIDLSTIVVTSPLAAVGVPVQVAVVTPIGESKPVPFTYVSSVPIEFEIRELLSVPKPTAVAFGPDGKLYVGAEDGVLYRFTLNDSYDTVVSSFSKQLDPITKRCILGIAFDPTETAELGGNLGVYVSTSEIYHGQYRNSFGKGVNGKIEVVRGANLELKTTVVSGLPVSEIDHAVNGIYFGKNTTFQRNISWCKFFRNLTSRSRFLRHQARRVNSIFLSEEIQTEVSRVERSRDQDEIAKTTSLLPFWWPIWDIQASTDSLHTMLTSMVIPSLDTDPQV